MVFALAALIVLVGAILLWRRWAAAQRAMNERKPELAGMIGRLREGQEGAAESALMLVSVDQPRFSKLGGHPDLPAGTVHPPGVRGKRAFLGQVDLAEVRAAGGPEWLPDVGRIYAFYDSERHGFADVVTVLYSVQAPGAPVAAGRSAFDERPVGFQAHRSLPSIDWMGVDYREFGGWLEDLSTPEPEGPAHRVGGYPDEIQGERFPLVCAHMARGLPDPEYNDEIPQDIEAAMQDWRLLLQVDSDPDLRMNFGDGGRLYVFIRRVDARRGEFGATVGAWSTY